MNLLVCGLKVYRLSGSVLNMITFRKACIKTVYYFYNGSGEIIRKRYRLFRDMAYVISYSN